MSIACIQGIAGVPFCFQCAAVCPLLMLLLLRCSAGEGIQPQAFLPQEDQEVWRILCSGRRQQRQQQHRRGSRCLAAEQNGVLRINAHPRCAAPLVHGQAAWHVPANCLNNAF